MQKVDFLETKLPLPNLFVLVADDTLVQRRSGATTLLTSSKMEITSTSAQDYPLHILSYVLHQNSVTFTFTHIFPSMLITSTSTQDCPLHIFVLLKNVITFTFSKVKRWFVFYFFFTFIKVIRSCQFHFFTFTFTFCTFPPMPITSSPTQDCLHRW